MRAHGASLFMVLQAGLAALLARMGAGEDIPIGTAVAGRGERSVEEMVGLFVNTLVLRTNVAGDPTFAELVKRARSFDLEAYGNQDLPFERLVEDLQPVRSLARQPLFQVMLVLQNAPAQELSLPGLHIKLEPLEGSVAKVDLTLTLLEQVDAQGEVRGLLGGLEYNADIFERSTRHSLPAKRRRHDPAGAPAATCSLNARSATASVGNSRCSRAPVAAGRSAACFAACSEGTAARVV